jgi:hypothetical protein
MDKPLAIILINARVLIEIDFAIGRDSRWSVYGSTPSPEPVNGFRLRKASPSELKSFQNWHARCRMLRGPRVPLD